MSDFLESTDTGRGTAPLKHVQSLNLAKPLKLELGGQLDEVTVVFETYGQLNDARDNAVLICHALSGDSHVASHDENDDLGWWDIFVGPGKAVDTDKYFVICPNVLGGCRGTTGPNSINPATKKPYGRDFPPITIGDMVNVHIQLIDSLGIDKLLATIGGSMGGHQVLSLACNYPKRVKGVIGLATSPRLSSQALAFDIVGRNAILSDSNFHNGQYYDKDTAPTVGLAIARMIGHITYLSREAMQKKFDANRTQPRNVAIDFEKKFSVGTYLGYKGTEFVERFDANSYVALSMAMDMFDLGDTVDQLRQTFRDNPCRFLTVSFSSDWLFSPAELQDVVRALTLEDRQVSYCNIKSEAGHDAFLLPDTLESYGTLTSSFLDNLVGNTEAENKTDVNHKPASIFHQAPRLDYQRILELIESEQSVLDLGCGDGELLARLKQDGYKRLVGVELDQHAVINSVNRGLDVIHADINEGLAGFNDKQFDCVILSQTLQAVRDVEGVIENILRVGKKCIISFPNFGYHKLRDVLVNEGRAPESSALPYSWYNTPNIRVITIKDFQDFCSERKINMHRTLALDTESQVEVTGDINSNADLAIFVISR